MGAEKGGGNGLYVHFLYLMTVLFITLCATSWLSSRSSSPPADSTVYRNPYESLWTREIWEAPDSRRSMLDLEAFQLTKEMVNSRAKDNVIIVTFANYAFLDFAANWVRHLTDLNVSNILVGAMDTKVLEALYWKGIPVFDTGSKVITTDPGWGTPEFQRMGKERVRVMNDLVPLGFEVLMCDCDMVWLKNPLPYLSRFSEADMLTSTDQLDVSVTDDSLEVWDEVEHSYNIGIVYWRPTEPVLRMAKEWKDELLENESLGDQNIFIDILRRRLGPLVGEDGLFYAFDGTLKLGLLPASIFCSGHTYFVQAMPQQLGLEPYAVHTTFQFAGIPGKRHRLREAMLFHNQPEYYDSAGGFLSFKPSIPNTLLLHSPHNLESHFSLVNYQLLNIRTALAVALLLNRTLVMPPLWCKFERITQVHSGIVEGTMTTQPFLCPMDHIFEVDVMQLELPEEEFGPRIDFREYSFLENPSLPRHVKESILEVEVCSKPQRCSSANIEGVLKIPIYNSQEKLVEMLSKYKDVKILQFGSMEEVFGGFSDKIMENKFRKRVKKYAGQWCCGAVKLGYIYYDMYWDEKRDWKPEFPKSIHPYLGDWVESHHTSRRKLK